MAKMGQFSPKSKAIALVICPILTKNQSDWFGLQSKKRVKWANFRQKVMDIYLSFLAKKHIMLYWLWFVGD